DNGATQVTGLIIVPPKCTPVPQLNSTCPTVAADVQVEVLSLDDDQTRIVNSDSLPLTTSSAVYNTGDISPILANSVSSNNSERSFIIVSRAGGSNNLKALRIGGIVPQLRQGKSQTKDFNATTHIACVAAVYETNSKLNPCSDGSPLTPDQLTDQRTDIL